jgi:hypothetical protein
MIVLLVVMEILFCICAWIIVMVQLLNNKCQLLHQPLGLANYYVILQETGYTVIKI